MEIQFWQGAVSEFADVPAAIYQGLLDAPSKTAYFQSTIWDRFPHRRIWRDLDELLLTIADVLVIEDRAISVHTRGPDNDTPLHIAAVWGDVAAIEMLVQAGADVDARGDLETTPLYNAVAQGHVPAARRLLELGASPEAPNDLNYTPADCALRSDLPQMRELFTMGRLYRSPGRVR